VGRALQSEKLKFAKIKISEIKKLQKQKFGNFYFCKSLNQFQNCFSQDCVLVLRDQRQDFASLRSIRNVEGAYLMRASSLSMKRRHLPGGTGTERTHEDTVYPMRRSPSVLLNL
jgi:hypothetical protein